MHVPHPDVLLCSLFSESFLLASMAFDRQAAVCKPRITPPPWRACAHAAGHQLLCLWTLAIFHPVALFPPLLLPFQCGESLFPVTFPRGLALSYSDIYKRDCALHWLSTPSSLFWIYLMIPLLLLCYPEDALFSGRQEGFSTSLPTSPLSPSSTGPASSMCLQPRLSHSLGSAKVASVF